MKVLVAEPLSEAGLDLLRRELEVDVRSGLSPEELASIIDGYDALVIRSATKVDATLLERAENLKVVGRAGIGLDNVDVEAATRHGILVVNAPQSNVLSAAEHTMALLLAQARNIPQAHSALTSGSWERERWQGVELHGKTLGIVGLGRVGTLVAQRASAFGMSLVAYDPYVSAGRAAQMGVVLVPTVAEVCAAADFMTIHLPKTPETVGIIGERELAAARPGLRIVNTARGGLVDEDALVRALKDGRVAGAAIDVFDGGTGHRSSVVRAPERRRYASSRSVDGGGPGQGRGRDRRAGLAGVPRRVRSLRGERRCRDRHPRTGAALPRLAERLGRIAVALAGTGHRGPAVRVPRGDRRTRHPCSHLAGLKGAFSAVVHEPVTFVNAPLLAKERGISMEEVEVAG